MYSQIIDNQNKLLLEKNNKIEELERNVEYYAKRVKSAESHIIKQNKRIAELEEQIEKMKCCHNCKHFAYSRCELRQLGFSCLCNSLDKWETKENANTKGNNY